MMFRRLRHWLFGDLLIAKFNLADKTITLEGVDIMDILSRLDALEKAVQALPPATDTSTFATADSVTALGARIDKIDTEIGASSLPQQEPPADQQPAPDQVG
jgi:hypothetical protein